jgi:hypothetical protein
MNILTAPWWTCVAGAMKYLSGERRSMPDQIECMQKCLDCKSLRMYHEHELHGMCGRLVRWFMPSHSPITGWCGEPSIQTETTCGCLVIGESGRGQGTYATVTIGRQEIGVAPAGKLTVESERCPQGKF